MITRLSQENEVVLELWREISDGWCFASSKIADAFRRYELTDGSKKEIVETLHEMLAQFRRLDFALQGSGATENGRQREIALLATALLLSGNIDAKGAANYVEDVNWGFVAHVEERIQKIEDPIKRFATQHSLPNILAERIMNDHGNQAAALAQSLNSRAPFSLRSNELKTTRDKLISTLAAENLNARATRFSPFGLELENPARAFSSDAFRDGLFEVQDEGSQLVAEIVTPARGSRVLDACAGTGGKTLALSALMGGTGTLLALDVSEAKLEELRRRARRTAAHNIRAIRTRPDEWPAEIVALSGKFNRVLVDAPCGGSGALRRNPESRWRDESFALDKLPILQESLARRSLDLCAVGGRLIYATCSVLHAENEAVVERILADGQCEAVPIKEVLSKARASDITSPCGRYVKLLPHIHGTDGFFAVVLRKK
ncbi:MAG: RsmB/NOP family class I SAM-dependent RNA methyltransferase [Planctomycetota bacterium]